MTNIILEAARYAERHHRGQFRKYSGIPYITHPASVAGRVSIHPDSTAIMVAAAWLHDVIEDCNLSCDDLNEFFVKDVGSLVLELTNPSKQFPRLSRKDRKDMDLEHIKNISKEAKIIKLFDRIDNLNDMIRDSHISECKIFLKEKYYQESFNLWKVLKDTDEYVSEELLRHLDFIKTYIL